MSVRVMAAVWDGYKGGGTELLALLALADWCDDAGRCYPSMSAIADKTRLSRSQAQRVVHRLIADGIVAVVGNATGGAPGTTRRYQILIDKLTGRADATPTGRMDATGSTGATGSRDAQEGPHGCEETGCMDATQTISEPSVNRQSFVAGKPDDTSAPEKLGAGGVPPCPHQEIIALYAEALPMLPQPRIWEGAQKKNLAARWRWAILEEKAAGRPHGKAEGLAYFAGLFAYITKSDFLTGRAKAWTADLYWIVEAKNFAKILQGNYENREGG